MINNFIRVLRNTDLCATREAAITKLEGKLATLQDGEICIASYGGSWDAAKTVLGVVRLKDGKRSYTIFDNEAKSAEIAAEIAKLDAIVRGNLTANDAIATGKHVGVKVVEEDGKLTGVTVVENDIASAAVLGTKDDATTVDTAFGRIAKEVADRKQAITNAINALDSSVAATEADGNQYSVLTGVTQADGKLTEMTDVKLAAVAKTGSAADVATTAIVGNDEHVAVAGTNVSDQITSIAKTLKGISNTQANALKYRTVKLSKDEVNELNDSNVKEAYKVVSYTGEWVEGTTTGTKVGDTIKIYKDATIHKIYLGYSDDTVNPSDGNTTTVTEDETKLSLNYVYITATGTYAMASVPVGSFLRQSEFKNGLHVANNGEVSVKVDTTSADAENFLSVGENGVKISGVQTAINNAIAGLDTTVESTGDGKVSVTVAEEDGKISGVTVTTPGLASEAEVVKSVTVNEVPSTFANNNASLTIKGGNIAVAGTYTATDYPAEFETKVGADNHILATDKIDAAFKKTENTISVLATEVISNEKVTTAAVSKLAESAGVLGEGGVIGYVPADGTTYISGATSVHDATVKLDAAIKNLGAGALTEVKGSNAIGVTTKASNSQTVSLKLDTTKDGDGTTPKPAGANALEVNANGLYLSNVWDCGEY